MIPPAPTVGRAVHYWMNTTHEHHVRNDLQPFAAVIVYVHADGEVTVRAHDHYGSPFVESHVPLRAPTGDERHGGDGMKCNTCTWPLIITK